MLPATAGACRPSGGPTTGMRSVANLSGPGADFPAAAARSCCESCSSETLNSPLSRMRRLVREPHGGDLTGPRRDAARPAVVDIDGVAVAYGDVAVHVEQAGHGERTRGGRDEGAEIARVGAQVGYPSGDSSLVQ